MEVVDTGEERTRKGGLAVCEQSHSPCGELVYLDLKPSHHEYQIPPHHQRVCGEPLFSLSPDCNRMVAGHLLSEPGIASETVTAHSCALTVGNRKARNQRERCGGETGSRVYKKERKARHCSRSRSKQADGETNST